MDGKFRTNSVYVPRLKKDADEKGRGMEGERNKAIKKIDRFMTNSSKSLAESGSEFDERSFWGQIRDDSELGVRYTDEDEIEGESPYLRPVDVGGNNLPAHTTDTTWMLPCLHLHRQRDVE
ncbi:unnamed protein product [Ilex paraguariensis]|uniref:Uncharacterized protein n=1 Tax=Ilex paraguariensis TaxID=185542 RepID=A0ABC8RII9_9AQUA